MNLLTATPAKFCSATNACEEGRRFALGYPTMAEVWDNCPRPDWLLWVARKIDRVPDDKTLRLFAVWCARHTPLGDGRVTGDLLTDPRSLAALEVAERHANRQASDAELIAAYANAADAAADAASDANFAAYAAAYGTLAAVNAHAAAGASLAAYATAVAAKLDANDIYDVAIACAADAVAFARAADAAAGAASRAAHAAQADQFRRMVANLFRL